MKDLDLDLWPIAVIQDRYNGVYLGGKWMAIAEADLRIDRTSVCRASWVLSNGPYGDDLTAMDFGCDIPKWMGVGNTPDEAIKNLKSKNK